MGDPRGAVLKIYNTSQQPGWVVPWQAAAVESSTGSGALISLPGFPGGVAVLTAAHVVADSRFLQVQRSSDRFGGEKLPARVAAVCHEADLALLQIQGPPGLMKNIVPLEVAGADELPKIFDRVRVCGYPVGGGACSVTEGVVSRIEVQEYSHSLRPCLALTVDAAINSGNSGGPLLDAQNGQVVGVAFQKLVARGVELQGHAVPAPLIRRFLAAAALASSKLVGTVHIRLPSLGCDLQSLEAPALRRSLGLPGDQDRGILISRAADAEPFSESALQAGDVLLAFDGLELDSNGFCQVLGQRLHFAAARDLRVVGETVRLTVWRGGRELLTDHVLRPANYLVPRGQYDCVPAFYVCGGLVFQPLSWEYLQSWGPGQQPVHLQELFFGGRVTNDRAEVVVLTQILADEVNQGYGSGFIGAPVVVAVNGEQIRDLAHLVFIVRQARSESPKTGFLCFETEGSFGPWRVVLPLSGLDEADERVTSLYGAPTSSAHFKVSKDKVPPSRL